MRIGSSTGYTAARMSESFQPLPHVAPDTPAHRMLFGLRRFADFQVHTVYGDVAAFLKNRSGAVADIGCGECPYRHLCEHFGLQYIGIDTIDAGRFSYDRPDVLRFDGKTLPLADDSVDAILCTEVLEHVEIPEQLIAQMLRVLKPGGELLLTLPWSVRYHYIPYDYCRYTPSKLRSLFRGFASVQVMPRGTDVTSICAKILVMQLRYAASFTRGNFLAAIPVLLCLPFSLLALLAGHLSLLTGFGSEDDPLGYTVVATK